MTRALILGIGGQDGSYLADILLECGYEVHGLHRRTSLGNLSRIAHIKNRLILHHGDMADPQSVHRIISAVKPLEVYNEADQDHVGWSYDTPALSVDITYGAVARTLESISRINCAIRFFQPLSATIFGNAPPSQNETTPFNPLSPYACAKAGAYHLCRHYRQTHGLLVSTAILFNHDSPRRTGDYLLHKICQGVARIARKEERTLTLGSLDMAVDVGFARDYMEAAWQILQQDEPDDFVIGTGCAWTIREMVEAAFGAVGIKSWEDRVILDPAFNRPDAGCTLLADPGKARKAFGFNPKTAIGELIAMLIKEELA